MENPNTVDGSPHPAVRSFTIRRTSAAVSGKSPSVREVGGATREMADRVRGGRIRSTPRTWLLPSTARFFVRTIFTDVILLLETQGG